VVTDAAAVRRAAPDPAVRRTRFATRDRAALEEFIDRTYAEHRPQYRDPGPRVEFCVTMTDVHGIGCDRVRNSTDVHAAIAPVDDLVAAQLLRGRVRMALGSREVRLKPGDSALYPVGAPLTADWDDVDLVVLRLPMARAVRIAADLTGIPPGDLRFESWVPVSAAMNRFWRSTVGFVNRELLAEEPALAEPLLADQAMRTLVAAALAVFPNTTMAGARQAAGGAAPAALRRAVDFIETNAHRPIGLTEVAAASRVGPRALQQGFARHYETSPIGYLRTVRMERAHRELQAADPGSGATVAEIAARWGFGKPGRFAADYRQRYGQLPSRTLRS
jgi:AraC-like DNA-binding protein